MRTQHLGTVANPTRRGAVVEVPDALLLLSAALVFSGSGVGTYVGYTVGGPAGCAVGALVGAFIGALGAGLIRKFKVVLDPSGRVTAEYETRF